MFDGPEYDRNGKVDQSKYTSDEYDFFNTMYGDKDSNKNNGSFKPQNTSGFWNWLKWQGASTWIIGALIALSIPGLGPILLFIIAIVFVIMIITA